MEEERLIEAMSQVLQLRPAREETCNKKHTHTHSRDMITKQKESSGWVLRPRDFRGTSDFFNLRMFHCAQTAEL